MGNQACGTPETYEQKFKSKYEFISVVNDPNFGDVKIYRKKQLNFDYVMVLHKYIQHSNLSSLVNEVEAIHACFLRQDEPMALRIFNFEVNNSEIRNCTLSLIKIYVEYFNFTLNDLILVHKQKGDSFSHDELVYILNSCVFTYLQFFNLTQKNIQLTTKSIYLSPQGCIKFCPLRPHQFFQHENPMCTTLCNQTIYKQINNFDRGQKYLLGQLRKIFGEIAELNFENNPQNNKIRQLFELIGKSTIAENIVHRIGQAKLQALSVTSYNNDKSTASFRADSNIAKTSSNFSKKPYSVSDFSERIKTNDNENVKLSLTKIRQ